MTRSRRGLLPTLLVLALAPTTGWRRGGEVHLTVFAAASLSESFTEIGRRFERQHRGSRVALNFAGSQRLAAQIREGAPADVFASADARWMILARDRGLVSGEPTVFARNTLAVVVPQSNPGRVRRLEDLARPGVRVVLAGPTVPAGFYARELLGNLSRVERFGADYARRVLANVVSQEQNVRGVVAKVQLGEADAGVVYATDLRRPMEPSVRQLAVPDEAQVLAEYSIAAVARSGDTTAARAFLALVLSPEGQAILLRHGFLGAGS